MRLILLSTNDYLNSILYFRIFFRNLFPMDCISHFHSTLRPPRGRVAPRSWSHTAQSTRFNLLARYGGFRLLARFSGEDTRTDDTEIQPSGACVSALPSVTWHGAGRYGSRGRERAVAHDWSSSATSYSTAFYFSSQCQVFFTVIPTDFPFPKARAAGAASAT